MRSFVNYLKDYCKAVSRQSLIITILLVALLITLNYTFGIETRIRNLHPWPLALFSYFFFYGTVYFFVWGLQYRYRGNAPRSDSQKNAAGASVNPILSASPRGADRRRFLLFLLLAPLFFAFKMIHWDLSILMPSSWHYPWDEYAQIAGQIPLKLLALLGMLYSCRKMDGSEGFYGLTTRNFNGRPYFLILLCLIPLIALASTQHDFLYTYPKVKTVHILYGYTTPVWPWKLIYELSYGLDFVSIELFFRGFLIIGLARYGGHYAILPMAAFYCTIHFGKPLGECISSFFGGLALGVIAWRTRSIMGGLIIHLGLAWLMEAGGWLGGLLRH
jgi:CAAX prenyl protease-like protein